MRSVIIQNMSYVNEKNDKYKNQNKKSKLRKRGVEAVKTICNALKTLYMFNCAFHQRRKFNMRLVINATR